MNTYFIKTEGPKGPRGGNGIRRKSIVIATSQAAAVALALKNIAEAGTVVTGVVLVDSFLCVSVS